MTNFTKPGNLSFAATRRYLLVYCSLMFLIAAPPARLLAQSRQEIARVDSAAVEAPSMEGSAPPRVIIPRVSTTLHVVAAAPEALDPLAPEMNVTQAEILSSAGTYGDFSRYLQVLPGVVWVSDLSNDVLVRGGHPAENLFVVDGVEVPNINHFSLSGSTGGFTSMIDSTASRQHGDERRRLRCRLFQPPFFAD
jgi:hypothetical protein